MQKNIVKAAPRLTDKAADFYKQIGGNLNAGVEYILEAMPDLYRYTLHSLKGRFSRGELMLMIDVNNGLFLTPRIAGQHMGIQVSDGIALDHLDEKWEIDGDALNKKVSALTLFESACLELWVQAFWNQEEHGNISEYVNGLTDRKGEGNDLHGTDRDSGGDHL